jgi:hypothetical protein
MCANERRWTPTAGDAELCAATKALPSFVFRRARYTVRGRAAHENQVKYAEAVRRRRRIVAIGSDRGTGSSGREAPGLVGAGWSDPWATAAAHAFKAALITFTVSATEVFTVKSLPFVRKTWAWVVFASCFPTMRIAAGFTHSCPLFVPSSSTSSIGFPFRFGRRSFGHTFIIGQEKTGLE